MGRRKGLLAELNQYVYRAIISAVGMSIYVLADSFFVAKGIGVLGVTVMNLTMPLFNLMEGLGLLLGMGGATIFTIYKISNPKIANRVFTQMFYIGLLLGAFFSMCGLLFASKITGILGADAETWQHTLSYVRIILICGPFFVFNNLILSFVRNDRGTMIAMVAMIISSLTNILLDWLLILVLKLGMVGAGLATSLSPMISILIILSHFFRQDNHLTIGWYGFDFKIIISAIQIGLPSFLTEMSNGIGIFVFNLVILHISGNMGVAAYGIATNILLVVLAIFTGVAQGIQPLVSRSYSEHALPKIKFVLKYGVACALVIGIVAYFIVFQFGAQIIGVFNTENNAQVIKIASDGMPIYFLSIFFSGINVVLNIFFASINKTRVSLALVFVRGYLLVAVVLTISALCFGMSGVWASLPIIELISLGLAIMSYFRVETELKNGIFEIG
ncbi:MATE family efflux transporter [Latilactobacillus curvatus]|uniref:MATE family efflux transporter n=1 Tax=Latilactobacillus curvatus TaxID=28038 RepID=UPI0021A55F6C|nr:MATE family efflux transporter [Latilactobacillus curvatus]MCT3359152.1 MATE family efflux transporter [Latilactobacillus curvatus]